MAFTAFGARTCPSSGRVKLILKNANIRIDAIRKHGVIILIRYRTIGYAKIMKKSDNAKDNKGDGSVPFVTQL